MKQLLYLLVACLLLSCNAERRAVRKARKSTSTTYNLPRPAKGDTATVKVTTPPKSVIGKAVDKVFPPKPPVVAADGSTVILPKNNKKGSISIAFSGNATSSIAGKKSASAVGEGAITTSIGKAKGPTATGDNATATDYTKQGQRGGAAASGDGATATNEPKEKGFPLWILLLAGGAYAAWFGLSKILTLPAAFVTAKWRTWAWVFGGAAVAGVLLYYFA